MKTIFYGKKISGILTVLPETESMFEDEIGNYSFPEKQTLRLKKIMGYEKHRIAKPETSSSDLCLYGMRYLLEKHLIKEDEVGAIICVTLTPDHFVPHNSNIIHGNFNFSQDVVCMDILQGCCGFLMGVMQAFTLLEKMPEKKVLLFNADVISHKVSKSDRNSYPLVGDAATITVLENDPSAADMHFVLRTDSGRRDIVKIPAGGSRMPCSAETAESHDDGEGNIRSLDNLCMNGSEVFRFVQEDVPPLIEEALEDIRWEKEDVDLFFFHQPNQFMLRKLAEKLGVPYEKVPMDIVKNYGNTSGATVPMTITHSMGQKMCQGHHKVCMSAFGSGMTWGVLSGELAEMDFCEMIISDC